MERCQNPGVGGSPAGSQPPTPTTFGKILPKPRFPPLKVPPERVPHAPCLMLLCPPAVLSTPPPPSSRWTQLQTVPATYISAHAVLLLRFPLLGVNAVVRGAPVLLAGSQALRG